MNINLENNQNINENGDGVQLQDLIKIFKRRSKIIIVSGVGFFILSFGLTIIQRITNPYYKGEFTLLISDPLSKQSNFPNFGGQNNQSSLKRLALNTTNSTDLPTLKEFLKSPYLIKPLAEKYDKKLDFLIDKIQIKSGGGLKLDSASGILRVSFVSNKPKKDINLLNDLSRAYLDTAINLRQQKLSDGLIFLSKQEPFLVTKVSEVQNKLAIFRQKNSLLEPIKEGTSLKRRETIIVDNILKLEAEKDRLLVVREEIKLGKISATGFFEKISSNTEFYTNEGLTIKDNDQSLLQEISKLEKQIAEARSIYLKNSPVIKSLEERLDFLKPQLKKNQLAAVDIALRSNQMRIEKAKEQQKFLNDTFNKQPLLVKEYESLQQELKINLENLSALINAKETFQLEIAQRNIPWRLISDPIFDNRPYKPSLRRGLFFSILLGGIIGLVVGFLRDRIDNVFHSPDQVVEDYDLPILGNITHLQKYKLLDSGKTNIFEISELEDLTEEDRYEKFFCNESLRNLYTSLRYLGTSSDLKTFSVTSSIPSEGKSITNTVLAKTISELGQSVLLIDCDLRKPKVHKICGLDNVKGLSNYLSDETLDWKDVVQEIPEFSNIKVITSGIRPPDPTRLLSSDRMNSLVKELKNSKKFDFVIFDCPPVIGLSDAMLVNGKTDGIILLISLEIVDRNLPKESIKRINSCGIPLLGLVTNQSVKPRIGTSPSSYGYGYKYAYKYNPVDVYYKYRDTKNEVIEENDQDNLKKPLSEKIKNVWKKISIWLDT